MKEIKLTLPGDDFTRADAITSVSNSRKILEACGAAYGGTGRRLRQDLGALGLSCRFGRFAACLPLADAHPQTLPGGDDCQWQSSPTEPVGETLPPLDRAIFPAFESGSNINAEKRKGTLAKLVSDTIDNRLKSVPFKTYSGRTNHSSLVKTVCETVNSAFEDTRRKVDSAVMDYLIERDGEADSFPNYFGNAVLSYDKVETACSLRFMYFGEDFEVTVPEPDKFVIDRKSKEFVYRDSYIPKDMKEYAKLKDEIERRPESVKLRKLRKLGDWEVDHPSLYLGFLLILLLLAGSSLLCLIWEMAAGTMTDGPLKAFVDGPLSSLSPDGLTGLLRSAATLLLNASSDMRRHRRVEFPFHRPFGGGAGDFDGYFAAERDSESQEEPETAGAEAEEDGARERALERSLLGDFGAVAQGLV